MFFVGGLSVLAAVYAIWRHYTVPRAPMVVPTEPTTEIPIETEPSP
jgi:hypothetical protein